MTRWNDEEDGSFSLLYLGKLSSFVALFSCICIFCIYVTAQDSLACMYGWDGYLHTLVWHGAIWLDFGGKVIRRLGISIIWLG